ncbi:glycosyltransferase family 4 protein [Sphingomonas sp. CFBP 13603]|uniref:glycosyltransferase family 4 protein n=1 Tax=Sphingomonas sp. CFBP 13603 TaxID=2774040 RepID=UPI0018678EBC|nr:glycosyltransferase family 1 protein [Sphingomonas sp. CFBP 13603]MBE2992947.1 glycosyltransferase family 4 protein [Sphingomonas sp. CFBP 13603]
MRVGLNATCFNDRPSGANQRFLGIYGALIRQNPDIEFVVYEPSDQRIATWFGDAPNVSARATPIPSVGRLARVRAGFNYWRHRLREDRLDLFEAFHLPLVRAPDCPTILTIHDLRPLLADTPLLTRVMSGLVLHDAFRRADHVIAVSDAVADEIRTFYPSANVSTVYNGVDPASFARPSAQAVAAVRARYTLPETYLLTIGHLEARKNLPLLIDAVALLRARGAIRPLAIVGNDGGDRAAIRSHIAEHGLEDLVTVIEHADDAAVRALYAGCEMLVFPSRYEGFGIPILEAMATDKPMVLADTAVFRELTSGQGVYFPVDDALAAADAIDRLWQQPVEHRKQVQFGRARLHDFTFDMLADQIAARYAMLV